MASGHGVHPTTQGAVAHARTKVLSASTILQKPHPSHKDDSSPVPRATSWQLSGAPSTSGRGLRDGFTSQLARCHSQQS